MFADLFQGPEQLSGEVDSGAVPAAVKSSPDLFSGVAAASSESVENALAASSPDQDDFAAALFGDNNADDTDAIATSTPKEAIGESAPVSPHVHVVEPQLTGQRNENSVLFSLGNLAALAGPQNPVVGAPRNGTPGLKNGGNAEGSGLIDIRAMAASFTKPATVTGPGAELPTFNQPSFDQASSVLLPTQTSSSGGKGLIYLLLGVIAVLAVVVVVILVKGGSGDDGKNTAGLSKAGINPGELETKDDTKKDDTKKDDTKKDDTKKDVTGSDEASDTKGGGNTTDSTVAKKNEDKTTEAKNTEVATNTKVKKEKAKESKGRSWKKSVSAKKVSKKSTRTAKKITPKPKKKESSKKSSGKCMDEVSCMVASNPPSCCAKYGIRVKKKSSSSSKSRKSNLPERLKPTEILRGIRKVRKRAMACGSKSSVKGRVLVKIKVTASGVPSVSVTSSPKGGAGLASCVKRAVRSARFPKTQKGGSSIKYPFTFR